MIFDITPNLAVFINRETWHSSGGIHIQKLEGHLGIYLGFFSVRISWSKKK